MKWCQYLWSNMRSDSVLIEKINRWYEQTCWRGIRCIKPAVDNRLQDDCKFLWNWQLVRRTCLIHISRRRVDVDRYLWRAVDCRIAAAVHIKTGMIGAVMPWRLSRRGTAGYDYSSRLTRRKWYQLDRWLPVCIVTGRQNPDDTNQLKQTEQQTD